MREINLSDLLQFAKMRTDGFTFIYDKVTGIYESIKNNPEYKYIISIKTLIEIKYINDEKYIITVYDEAFKYIDNLNKQIILIGGWLNKTNNTYYIELNTYTNGLKEAICLGQMFKQKAIYDNIKGVCINV
jgi:hypothetical protein